MNPTAYRVDSVAVIIAADNMYGPAVHAYLTGNNGHPYVTRWDHTFRGETYRLGCSQNRRDIPEARAAALAVLREHDLERFCLPVEEVQS